MGFGVIVSTVLMFIVIFFVAVSFMDIYKDSVRTTSSALKKYKADELKELHTRVEIERVNYSRTSEAVVLKIRNTGSITLDPDNCDVYLDRSRIERQSWTSALENEVLNPGLWDPQEVLEATVPSSLDEGNHVVEFVTEYRIRDVGIFTS